MARGASPNSNCSAVTNLFEGMNSTFVNKNSTSAGVRAVWEISTSAGDDARAQSISAQGKKKCERRRCYAVCSITVCHHQNDDVRHGIPVALVSPAKACSKQSYPGEMVFTPRPQHKTPQTFEDVGDFTNNYTMCHNTIPPLPSEDALDHVAEVLVRVTSCRFGPQ